MKYYKILGVIPFVTLTLIPFIKIYYVVAIFFIAWLCIFLIKKNYTKKLSTKEIENVAKGISKKHELEKLYKDLIKKVHPDKNLNNLELSKEYSEKINKFRFNFDELKKLETEINKLF